jgi:GxxExxY protein
MAMVTATTQTTFLYGELTHAIIGAAMEVHRILGPGFLESVYEEALAHEFELKGLTYERQKVLSVKYKNVVIGRFIADYVIAEKVLVELKAIKMLTKVDEAQVLNYLRATGLRVGLLLNFGTPSLEHWRRVV